MQISANNSVRFIRTQVEVYLEVSRGLSSVVGPWRMLGNMTENVRVTCGDRVLCGAWVQGASQLRYNTDTFF